MSCYQLRSLFLFCAPLSPPVTSVEHHPQLRLLTASADRFSVHQLQQHRDYGGGATAATSSGSNEGHGRKKSFKEFARIISLN